MFSIVVKLTGKFTSLEELTDVFHIATVVVFPADGSDFIRSERRIEPKEFMQKLKF
jgi:hypothetical protein